jgi:hypothetical protein
MYADARLSEAMEGMVHGIDAPAVPMTAIRDRMAARLAAPARRRTPFLRYALAAAVAIALFFAIFPKTSLAVLFERIVVSSYAAAYKVLGWTPPPNPSKMLDRTTVASQTGSLAAAQSRVSFTIVPPAGLPPNVTAAKIQTNSGLTYTKSTHVWSRGPVVVWFTYRLSDGRTLQLIAEPYDPRTGPPPKYTFTGEDLPGGKVALTKYEHFAWRNGDQVMSATEGDGITGREIEAVRDAMHGVELKAWKPGDPNTETVERRYRLP